MSLEETWQNARAAITAARAHFPRDMDDLRSYEEFLDHNELELALDELEALAENRPMAADFWREMRSAAETMGLASHVNRYRLKSSNPDAPAELADRLEAELKSNPLYVEMRSLPWVGGPHLIRWADKNNKAAERYFSERELGTLSSVISEHGCPLIALVYLTAFTVPEPLAGHGDTYSFFFDPVSLKPVLGKVAKNSWRS